MHPKFRYLVYLAIFLIVSLIIIIKLNKQSFQKNKSSAYIQISEKIDLSKYFNSDINNTLNKSLPSVFCIIKTHPNNIKINKALNVYKVWGRKCDNYRFITLLPDHLRPITEEKTVEVFENFYMIQPKGLVKEDHSNLTLKLYYSMIYVYEKFPYYDWYYIVDDDAYVNIPNLKEFLKDKSKNESITYGYNFKVLAEGGYHSGGPGYVFSNAAFTSVSKAMAEDINNCPNTGIDDLDVNVCVRKYKGKKGVSIDEYGRERFLVLNITTHFTGSYPDWLKEYAENPLQGGLNCCADDLIGVHYMTPRDVFRLDLAIEIQKNIIKMYDDYMKLGKRVTFKNIIKNYYFLEDVEYDTNSYKELINF